MNTQFTYYRSFFYFFSEGGRAL